MRALIERPSAAASASPRGSRNVTDDNNRVLRLAAGATTQTELPFTGLNRPMGVAVDTAGNVYVADSDNNRVLKLPPH